MLNKLITIRNNNNDNFSFTIKVDTDLSVPVLVDSSVSIRFCDETDSDILGILSSVISTNNKNKTFSNYFGVNPNLALSLYKKVYDSKTSSYILSKISTDLNSNGTKFQCNEVAENVASVFLVSSFVQTQISTKVNFDSNISYTLEFDFEKIFPLLLSNGYITGTDFTVYVESIAISSNKVYINYITATPDSEAPVTFSSQYNNILYKFNNLDKISNIQYMLEHGDEFNFQFVPVKNVEGVTLQETSSTGDEILIQVDNQKMIEELFLKQYLPEYIDYFKILSEENNSVDSLLLELKKFFYTKSVLINSSVKGTLEGIQNILSLFCTVYGNYVAVVEPDPSGYNFIYRITTNLPRYYWSSVIRKIVHPLSWKDDFIYIETSSSLPNTNVQSFENYKSILKALISGLTEIPKSFLDVSHNTPYNSYASYYELSSLENFNTQYKFSFKPNEYNAVIDYSNPTLLNMLTDDDNVVVNMELVSDKYIVTISYDKIGYVLEYEFNVDVIHNNLQEDNITTTTTDNKIVIEFDDVSLLNNMQINLKLYNKYTTTPLLGEINKTVLFSNI